ncbi:MAG: TonB family protein [Pseudohongiellaceae bacterium]
MTAIARDFFKINSAVLLAALVTFLLFYFMQYLIETESDRPQLLSIIQIVDPTVPEFKPELITNEAKPEPIVVEEVPIVSEPTRSSEITSGPVLRLSQERLKIDTSPQGVIPMANNIMIPLIRTTANYPSRALQRGIEGFVELSFTVDRFGSVVDPVVLNAVPEGIFERSALQSINKWKYAPAMNNGQATETYDVRQRIVFQIDPDSR